MGFNHWLCMCLIQCYSHTRGPGPVCGWYIYYWRRKWQPTPVFLPGESQGWSLVGCRLWGRTVRHNWRDLAAAAYFSLTCIIYLLLKFFFKIWAICKDFIEFVTILLQYIYIYTHTHTHIYIYIYIYILCFGFFGHEACGIFAHWPEIEPIPPALEGEVLTTGSPRKSVPV